MLSETLAQNAVEQESIRRQGSHPSSAARSQPWPPTGQESVSYRKGSGQARDGDVLYVEIDLVSSARAGDLTAFNQLIEAHQDGLYRWVLSLVNEEALAEDITQITFIKAYQKLNTFRGRSFRAWLFTIARNHSFDELRWKKRHPSLSFDDSPDDDRDMLAVLPDKSPLPEEVLEAAEQAATIEALLSRLPDMFQQVVRLVDMEGLDYQEAADILGVPLGTIKSRLTRARLKLRDMLAGSSHLRAAC